MTKSHATSFFPTAPMHKQDIFFAFHIHNDTFSLLMKLPLKRKDFVLNILYIIFTKQWGNPFARLRDNRLQYQEMVTWSSELWL